SGPLNMFLVKYDPNGNVLWARNSTGTVGIVANSVCTDAAGNTLITGYFLDSVATLGTYTLTNGGTAENIFLAKYDAAGNVLWATSEGSTGYDFGNAVCTDGAGNVYLTGAFQSPVISFGTYTLTNTGVQNVFLAKYDMNGNALWAERAAGSYADQGNSVTCDVAGNVYITGFFKSPSVSFGTYTLTNSVGVNVPNIFMVKYDATGNVLWARGAGGSGGFFGDVGYSVSSYTNGVFLAGALGSPTLALGTYTLSPPPGSSDPMFIAGYDFNGNVIYATALASGGDDINGISCDQFCNVYVTGDFIASPFVIGTTSLTLIGTENPFVAKFALTCQPTNVNSLSTEENVFLISPNPNNGAFRLQVDGEIENGEVALINSLGQTVFTQTVKKGMNGVVTTVLSKGLYHYVILQNNRPIGRGKLLID
ncbi:MAG: T9SS type A sorting domain-containing protein, partial [Bacteroidia bacterium]